VSKPIHRRHALSALTGSACALLLPRATLAQGTVRPWPVDTVRLIVPAPAGGAVDLFVRQVTDQLAPLLGVKVVLDNRAGAGGLVGARALASAPPDGSAFGYAHGGLVTLQAMGAKLDLVSEFVPAVARFSVSQFVIAVHAQSPWRTFDDLLRAAQAAPGKLSFGSGGQGTPGHLLVEMLRARLPGLVVNHVPYKGAVEAVGGVIAKDLDFVSGLISAVAPQVASGRLRALAVSGEARSPLLPQVATLAESGLPGFSHVSWGGIWAPAKTPAPLLQTMANALQQIAAMPDFKAFVASIGSEMHPPESASAFEAYLKGALATEAALVAKLGLKLQ
jgi:tripartite-type tricarboxylate transporter receptor subunit TctC